ncbi:MAG: FAD binding domain-containing protein [Anaerolineales bacterium]|nr:FAD binding domain-containing protein [Anaerolineales bacterium]
MILEYYRPETLEKALLLLSNQTPKTVPLGGGTVLNAPSPEDYAVVDLQALGWDVIEQRGRELRIGATASLQMILDHGAIQPALRKAIQQEAAYNLRQSGTAAGGLVSGGGRSPYLSMMLAMDADLVWQPNDAVVPLGEFLPLRGGLWPGAVISEIRINAQIQAAFHFIARSLADKPVMIGAAARWPSGRTRLVLGGYGKAPITILDGEANQGVLDGAETAYLTAGDQWASAEYRSEMARVLAQRCLEEFE